MQIAGINNSDTLHKTDGSVGSGLSLQAVSHTEPMRVLASSSNSA